MTAQAAAQAMPSPDAYAFSVGVELLVGKPEEFEIRDWVMRSFRVDNVHANAPCAGFIEIESIVVDGMEALYDDKKSQPESWDGRGDYGRKLDLMCKHGVQVCGRYRGAIPDGGHAGELLIVQISLQGTLIKD